MNSDTPVMVPPVPTPATRMSTLPSVSFQISSAVVLRWTSGLAGFSNCCGMKEFGGGFQDLPRLLYGALHALRGAGVRTSSAPKAFSSLRRSTLMLSGMVRMQR